MSIYLRTMLISENLRIPIFSRTSSRSGRRVHYKLYGDLTWGVKRSEKDVLDTSPSDSRVGKDKDVPTLTVCQEGDRLYVCLSLCMFIRKRSRREERPSL